METTLYEASAMAYVVKYARWIPTGVDLFAVANRLAVLSGQQDERVAAGGQPSPIPLIWVALAEAAGLRVDESGKIVGGPELPEGGAP